MLQKFMKLVGGNPNKREVDQLTEKILPVNDLEPQYEKLSDAELCAKTGEFRARLAAELNGVEDEVERQAIEQAVLDELLPEAFAAVREASKRTLGLRHYDVQLIGGAALHSKKIAEMRTGEGKTLVATLPLYLNALTGRGVHLITVNDYLSRRDARWMGPIYDALGLTVGILQSAAATENGKKAFIYDPEHDSPQEDKHRIRLVDRRLAYEADITYGTNAEFGFDYLRDNMIYTPADKVQRGHYFAIVDEVDNVLIDEARTPLIISGPASGDLDYYGQMAQLVKQLIPEDYEINEKDRSIAMTEIGTVHVEQLLGQPLRDPERPEDVTPEQARLLGHLEQALRAQYLFRRNKDYLVQAGKVVIVDEFTGRLMVGRRWSDGLHQAIEAKEGVKIEPENVTYATITLQNYFRMYQKLSGMTGTALTEAEEFHKIYKLEVLPIPTNLEYNAALGNSPLVEVKTKDDAGYDIAYFSARGDTEKAPVFWRRADYPDVVYRTVEAKLRAIVTEIIRDHVLGRPMLVGTTSVESSERLSGRLKSEPVRRLLQVQLLRHVWFENSGKEEDGRLVPELEPLYKPLDQLEPLFLRNFAKPLNLSINLEEPANLSRLVKVLRLEPEHEARLKAVIQGGVPHEVLNARKHTEESQIIAAAGAYGSVTIATNMAGRGVDIKLGGELADEIIAIVSRVLKRAGFDPYNMRLEEQRQAILKMAPSDFGIYESEIHYFLKYFEDMETVRRVGGLHVIGSERHEARRIDNQLRGRAARQGDPGSSRFYLSLQDDLMRLFGGEQVDNIMQRFHLDDDFPLENRMVTGLIEQSQHRVEGSNFDVRKHLLEYDDVLNKQRTIIYSQRDRAMIKADLTEDIATLLKDEIAIRVPPAMKDEEGPWKLLAWLEQIQPPFAYGDNKIFPSFTYRLLLDELSQAQGSPTDTLLGIVQRAVEIEEGHIYKAIETAVAHTAESLETQIQERFDSLDTFFDALKDNEEPKKATELQDELKSVLHIDIRFNNEQLKLLTTKPEALEEPIKQQVDLALSNIAITRLLGSIEYRLNEQLSVKPDELARMDWNAAAASLMESAQKMLENRRERLIGKNGQAAHDLEIILGRMTAASMDESDLIGLLSSLARGRRTIFNPKTHKQEVQEYPRFSYFYLAAQILAGRKPESVQDDVLAHLEDANAKLLTGWGHAEYAHLSQNAVHLSDFGPASEKLELAPDTLVSALTSEQRSLLMSDLGQRRTAEIHRNVLLSVITELWVEYLTRVEALRVSIGLEAYGQRDPLVQYKTKASDMFQVLLGEVRSGVIDRVFRYLPRMVAAESNPEPEAEAAPAAAGSTSTSAAQADAASRAARKRHKKK
jgi:preprotein translocase subunit SecA